MEMLDEVTSILRHRLQPEPPSGDSAAQRLLTNPSEVGLQEFMNHPGTQEAVLELAMEAALEDAQDLLQFHQQFKQ